MQFIEGKNRTQSILFPESLDQVIVLRRRKVILNTTDFTALYDKGYHTGSEIKKAVELGIHIMVAIPEVASNAPDTVYNVANFKYDNTADCYSCPQEKILFTNGKWYNKDRGKSSVKVKPKLCNSII